MRLDPSDIQEFKKLYEEEYKAVLSDAEAEEMATRVLQIYQFLAQPLPSERSARHTPSRPDLDLQ